MRHRTTLALIATALCLTLLLAPAIARAECAGGNAVSELSSKLEDFPTALDFGDIAASGAKEKRGGTGIYIYLSNTDFSLAQMASSMVSPIKDPAQGVLILKLSNGSEAIAPGEYSPSAGYGKPYFASAELRRMKSDGKAMDLVFNLDGGTIRLEEMAAGRACGTFDLQGVSETRLSGSFDVEIE